MISSSAISTKGYRAICRPIHTGAAFLFVNAAHDEQHIFLCQKGDSQMKSKDLTAVDQRELPLSRKAHAVSVPLDLVVKQPSLSGAIALCVQVSGLEEKEVYLSLEIDAGHWTRIMKGDAHFPVNKLNPLMDLCQNEAPLLWLTHSRGYGIVMLKSEAERHAELAEHRADEAEKKLEWAMEIMGRKAA